MSKKLKFIITTIWLLFSRSYDAYCTYLLTPDLSKEANPLVTILGVSSWTPLLIILSVLTIYVIYAYFISVFRPMNLLPQEKGYTFSNFVAYLYLGVKDHWTSTLYKLPKDINRLNNYMGHILTKCLVFAGMVSTIMWVLINNSAFYKTFHSAPLIYAILIIGCISITYNWNKSMYRQYLANSSNHKA